VEEARQEHVDTCNDNVENYKFIVVGRGARQSHQTQKTDLNCLIINAQSVINKLDLLVATVCDLKPDVLGITESWANDHVLDSELQLQGYQLFRCDRPTDNRGGGVLLYVKSCLKPVEFHTLSQYGEHVWCQIDDLLVGVCYRSTNEAIVGNNNESKLYSVLFCMK